MPGPGGDGASFLATNTYSLYYSCVFTDFRVSCLLGLASRLLSCRGAWQRALQAFQIIGHYIELRNRRFRLFPSRTPEVK